jgi:peptidoglycan/xylan/chitin deacetylase (PgdA/CDA1 family)
MPSPPPLALAYHGVADVPLREDPHGLFVRPRDLRRHIRALRRWGYELVTFGELAARAAEGRGPGSAALTFDDGLADNLHELVPVLREEGARATVFVVSEWLGKPYPYRPASRMLTTEELVDLHRAGVEIGGHTATHPDLTTVSASTAERDLRAGRETLEDLIGAAVDVLAYPYGRATAESREAAGRAGFRAAARTSANGSWSDPLDLPRQDMDNPATMLGLRLKRDDRYEQAMGLAPARALRRAVRAAKGVWR